MKKMFAVLLTLALALSVASPAFAATKKHRKHARKHVAAKHVAHKHARKHAAHHTEPAPADTTSVPPAK
jgi:hypothetical protein